MFKVGTECTLCCTLSLAVMLRFDLSEEDISEPVVGFLMLCANTIVPGAALAVGIFTKGLELPEGIAESRLHQDSPEDGDTAGEDNPVFEEEVFEEEVRPERPPVNLSSLSVKQLLSMAKELGATTEQVATIESVSKGRSFKRPDREGKDPLAAAIALVESLTP